MCDSNIQGYMSTINYSVSVSNLMNLRIFWLYTISTFLTDSRAELLYKSFSKSHGQWEEHLLLPRPQVELQVHARSPALRAAGPWSCESSLFPYWPGITGLPIKEAGDQQLLSRVAHVDFLLQRHLCHDVHVVQLVPLPDGINPRGEGVDCTAGCVIWTLWIGGDTRMELSALPVAFRRTVRNWNSRSNTQGNRRDIWGKDGLLLTSGAWDTSFSSLKDQEGAE